MGVIEREQGFTERASCRCILERDRLRFTVSHVTLPVVAHKFVRKKKRGPSPAKPGRDPRIANSYIVRG
jgi:hypothetical protein